MAKYCPITVANSPQFFHLFLGIANIIRALFGGTSLPSRNAWDKYFPYPRVFSKFKRAKGDYYDYARTVWSNPIRWSDDFLVFTLSIAPRRIDSLKKSPSLTDFVFCQILVNDPSRTDIEMTALQNFPHLAFGSPTDRLKPPPQSWMGKKSKKSLSI